MHAIFLNKQRKKRLEQGHPWIFASEIERTEWLSLSAEDRAAAEDPIAAEVLAHVYDHKGRFLATALYNPHSQMVGRVISEHKLTTLDLPFFLTRFRRAWQLRTRFVEDPRACRAIYGEADWLPGLVVDKYDDVLVVQILSLAMDRYRDSIVAALVELFNPRGIYERSDVRVRTLEGLEERSGLLYGDVPRHVAIVENGLNLTVDIHEGQKTGYFFDQRENRAAIGPLMRGWGARSGVQWQIVTAADGTTSEQPVNKNGTPVTYPYWDGATVLECFAHTGSFTLHACKYGAKKVTCLDISEHAIDTARQNVARNDFTERVEFVVADAFQFLREQVRLHEEGQLRAGGKLDSSVPMSGKPRRWDVIILDPPAFAKHRGAIENAAKGYKEIHLQALKLLTEGGFLVTASCSYHIRPQHFLDIIAEAAHDAGKRLRLLHFSGAGHDHPHILGVDEGHYLKFAMFEVTSKTSV